MKKIIIMHGYTVTHEDWDYVVFGDPKTGKLGRVTKALQLALTLPDCILLFSTGASKTPDGAIEADYTRQQTMGFLFERRYSEYPQFTSFSSDDSPRFLVELVENALMDNESVNTWQTLEFVHKMLGDDIVNHTLYHVSSLNHIPRISAYASRYFTEQQGLSVVNCMVPADTAYFHGSTEYMTHFQEFDKERWEEYCRQRKVGGNYLPA